jgi:hypothetical protein
MDARPLPARPNLDYYKKQAKDLLKVCRSGDAERIRAWVQRWMLEWKDSWMQTMSQLSGRRNPQWLEAEFENRVEAVVKHVSTKVAKKDMKLAEAQFFIARAHGFDSWPKFSKQVTELAKKDSRYSLFERAVDLIVSGEIEELRKLLAKHPSLIHERSLRDHHSTLLHYVGANGVEGYRQVTPKNIVEITRLLLDAGADIDSIADMYDGSNTIGLVATSVHPLRAGVQLELLDLLLKRGAKLEMGRGKGSVRSCLANGRREAARFLAERGAPLDLETAAGTGFLDVVKTFFDSAGELKPTATRKQMEHGFIWSCQHGYLDVAEFLFDRGVDIATGAVTAQTALHLAAHAGQVEAVKFLLAHKASLQVLNCYGGTVLGQALWSAYRDPQPTHPEVVRILVAAGADVNAEGGMQKYVDEVVARDRKPKA